MRMCDWLSPKEQDDAARNAAAFWEAHSLATERYNSFAGIVRRFKWWLGYPDA